MFLSHFSTWRCFSLTLDFSNDDKILFIIISMLYSNSFSIFISMLTIRDKQTLKLVSKNYIKRDAVYCLQKLTLFEIR